MVNSFKNIYSPCVQVNVKQGFIHFHFNQKNLLDEILSADAAS
jgi:hypothetical protein